MNKRYFYDDDPERAILGICFVYPEHVDDFIAKGIDETWFTTPNRKTIWSAIKTVNNNGEDADVVNVYEELGKMKKDEEVGRIACVELAGEVATDYHRDTYFDRLREYMVMRRLDNVITKMQTMVYDRATNSDEVIEFLTNEVNSIEATTSDNVKHLGDIFTSILQKHTSSDKPVILPTGFSFDENLELHLRETTALAGESSIGKTSLMTNICMNVNDVGFSVLIFSLEMDAEILGMRCISARSNIHLKSIRNGTVSADRLMNAMDDHYSESLYIEDSVYNTDRIESITRRMAKKHGIKLIVLDYMQLTEPSRPGERREQEISDVGKMLKRVAKASNLHAIGISSLDESWGNKYNPSTPTKRNLSQSKALAYHFDNVVILYRDEKKNIRINIDKARNDETKSGIPIGFIGATTKFVDKQPWSEP